MITGIHHIAIICSDYAVSKHFYHTILGFEIVGEHFRAERNSWKLDLKVSAFLQIELFSFPNAPERPSYPEALGLRHLCFSVADLDKAITHLNENGISTEPIRVDEYTGKRFVFFADPDKLPIELYEA
jgi:glyoxylase I family protein